MTDGGAYINTLYIIKYHKNGRGSGGSSLHDFQESKITAVVQEIGGTEGS